MSIALTLILCSCIILKPMLKYSFYTDSHLPLIQPSAPRVLAPIQRVTDPLTGHERYPLDPFCPSSIEFQRRGEDELTKFIYILVRAGATIKTRWPFVCKYRDPVTEAPITAKKALSGPALDFRWQMKHLQFNRCFYCQKVLDANEEFLWRWTKYFREEANKMAHQQHLKDLLQPIPNPEAINTTQMLLDKMVTFAEEIYPKKKHNPVSRFGIERMYFIGALLIT